MTTFPKPGKRSIPAVKVHRDGREVCADTHAGREEYSRRKHQMYQRDHGICCVCNQAIQTLVEATFEHKKGRGMGSGHRDDRAEFNGVAHGWCNSLKGSRRL